MITIRHQSIGELIDPQSTFSPQHLIDVARQFPTMAKLPFGAMALLVARSTV